MFADLRELERRLGGPRYLTNEADDLRFASLLGQLQPQPPF